MFQADQRTQQSLAYGKEKHLKNQTNVNIDTGDFVINDDNYSDSLTKEVEEKFAQLGKLKL